MFENDAGVNNNTDEVSYVEAMAKILDDYRDSDDEDPMHYQKHQN